jgi:hypothetical protein
MEQVIINKTERPNSYEFGKAGARVKLYFETADDLKLQMDKLLLIGVPAVE